MRHIAKGIIVSTLVLAALPTASLADKAKPPVKVKITDGKLSTVNYSLESVEYWLKKMQPGDKAMAAKIDRDLLKTIERFRKVKDVHQTQRDAIAKRIQKAAATLQTKSPVKRSINNLAMKVPSTNQIVNSKPVDSKLQSSANEREISQQEASAMIIRLQKKYHDEIPVPKLQYKNELKAAAVDQFVEEVQSLRTEVAKDLPHVRQLAARHRHARYLLGLLETKTESNIKKSLDNGMRQIDGQVKYVMSFLSNQAKLDPKTNAYAFNNEKTRVKNEEQFARTARTITQLVRLQKLLGLTDTYNAPKVKFEKDLVAWRGKFSEAVAGRKLPKDIDDKELRKIAESVLRKEKYGVGEIETLIINAKKRPGERIEHKSFAGRLETIIRVWEEFQVATVEVENGKYFLYFNTLTKFSRAPRTTPVNEWILSKRIKSGEIARAQVSSRNGGSVISK